MEQKLLILLPNSYSEYDLLIFQAYKSASELTNSHESSSELLAIQLHGLVKTE